MVVYFLPLAQMHARRLERRAAPGREDDLLGAAAEGLMAAIAGYDPRFGCKFATYASRWIVGAIQDYLRENDPQSRTTRLFGRSQDQARQRASCDADRPATEAEVASGMGLSADAYERLSARRRAGECVSLDAESESGVRRHSRGAWSMADARVSDPSSTVEREWVLEFLCRGLTPTQRHVLILYYYENLTLAEIGRVLRLCEARISQIRREAVEKLAERLSRPGACAAMMD